MVPATVGELLTLSNLGRYSEAFETHGWDDVSALFSINEADLANLIRDVSMPNGHVLRLRTALGKAAPPVPTAATVFEEEYQQ